MGKSQSRPGSNWSWSYKRRENPEGDSYILRGCINARYRDSEEHLWTAEGSADPVPSYKSSHGSPYGAPHDCDGRHDHRTMGVTGDLCSLKVALPPEVTGSRCSLKVQAMQDTTSSPNKKLPPHSPSRGNAHGTIGAVDCDVSLDAEKETQEWAFTLYDFDGHRRITREDLSSILKSISEALACSVILPPSGSRKLKLRLSVVSDQEAESRNGSMTTPSSSAHHHHHESPSHDNLSGSHRSASTQSTSLPSTLGFAPSSPLATAAAAFGKQENKENALNRARDRLRSPGDPPSPLPLSPTHQEHPLQRQQHHHQEQPQLQQMHRHSFNANHQCWRKEEKRSRRTRHHGRSHSLAPADPMVVSSPYTEQASPERQHRKARKSSAAPDHSANKTAQTTAVTASKQINNAGTNCSPTERPQENAERRSYYQELAGIDHQCTAVEQEQGQEQGEGDGNGEGEGEGRGGEVELELPLGASANSRTHQKLSKVNHHHHRRSKSYEPHAYAKKSLNTAAAAVPAGGQLHMNQELYAKYVYAQRHHKDYHMQLLEASRTRLEGLQPQSAEAPVVKSAAAARCHRHSVKRHSFPAGPVQVVTTQVLAPPPTEAPTVAVAPVTARGRHRRRSRRHYHTLQPLTVMKHEVVEKKATAAAGAEGGVVYSPVSHKHQHHHHHEHHHHHHYHHYHDID